MGFLRKTAKRIVTSLAGIDVEHVGGKSYFLIDAANRAPAWYSYRATLRSLLQQYDVNHVIDVGANVGHFGQYVRGIFAGKISSFEPVSSVFRQLSAKAAADGNWDAYPFALGSRTGTATINVSADTVFSSLLKSNDYCATRFGEESAGSRTETITVRRLDEVLAEIAPKPGSQRIYLTLDTQGYDVEVFSGLGERLKDVVALQSEVSLIPIYENMPHWTESIALYEKSGFGVVGLYPVTRDSNRIIEYNCILARV